MTHALSDAQRRILMKVHEILQRPYTRELIRRDDGSWLGRIVEFDGCVTAGETREEAEETLGDAALLWLVVSLQHGYAIPEPTAPDAPFGAA